MTYYCCRLSVALAQFMACCACVGRLGWDIVLSPSLLFKQTLPDCDSNIVVINDIYRSYTLAWLQCLKLLHGVHSDWGHHRKPNSGWPISRSVAAPKPAPCGPESGVLRSLRLWVLLLCRFKYSRQCCWSVWERLAHGAALPPQRQTAFGSRRTGDRNDRSTRRLHHIYALSRPADWSEGN